VVWPVFGSVPGVYEGSTHVSRAIRKLACSRTGQRLRDGIPEIGPEVFQKLHWVGSRNSSMPLDRNRPVGRAGDPTFTQLSGLEITPVTCVGGLEKFSHASV
jgi:hypothetical protein